MPGARAHAQEEPAPAGSAVLDALDAERLGTPHAPLPDTLVIKGHFRLAVSGTASDRPMQGTVEMDFAGDDVYEISDYGDAGIVERGIRNEVAWEIHPA